MQILVQVVCTRGPSLRDAIAKNPRLDKNLLSVSEQKRSGRSRGWTKVHSTEPDRRGDVCRDRAQGIYVHYAEPPSRRVDQGPDVDAALPANQEIGVSLRKAVFVQK